MLRPLAEASLSSPQLLVSSDQGSDVLMAHAENKAGSPAVRKILDIHIRFYHNLNMFNYSR